MSRVIVGAVAGGAVEHAGRQIGYYQWVPFILMIQSLMFVMPCLMWRLLNWQTGINLALLTTSAHDAVDSQCRTRAVRFVARVLVDTLDLQAGALAHRVGSVRLRVNINCVDSQHGCRATVAATLLRST
jgi:hypothetical protein